jgi:DNA-binding MarR family transcriptional regulator
MVRKPNESQARLASGRAAPSGRAASGRFLPRRPPIGTANFGNLFRDPTMVMQELVAEELVRRGFADLRPALLAVGQHVGAHGTRITELAERAQLSKATVVHVVDELERLGYVTREPDPTDGRAKLVRSTPRAREAERAAREAVADIQAAWTEVIGRRDMAALEAALRRLRAALWPEPGDAAA